MFGKQSCICAIAAVLIGAFPGLTQCWEVVQALKPGDRLKIVDLSGKEHSGALRSVSPEAISWSAGKDEVTMERAKIRTVKVKATARRWRNFLIGAAIGVGVGAIVDNTLGAYFRNESGQTAGARAVTYIAPIGIFGG